MNYYRYEMNATLMQQIHQYIQKEMLNIFDVPFCFDNLKISFPETKIEASFTPQKNSLGIILTSDKKERIRGRLTAIKTGKGNLIYAEYNAGESEYTKKRLSEALKFTVLCCLMINAVYYRKTDKELPFVFVEGTESKSNDKILIIRYFDDGTEPTTGKKTISAPAEPFSVKGHYRHLKSGKIVWVRSYEKNKKAAE